MLKKFQCASNGPKSTNANFKVSGVFDIAFIAVDITVVDVVVAFVVVDVVVAFVVVDVAVHAIVVAFVAAIIVVFVLCMVSERGCFSRAHNMSFACALRIHITILHWVFRNKFDHNK